MKKSLLAAALAVASLVSLGSAAEPKRVIVCTVTTGFRHSSIPYAEKTLQKLADESKAFTIVRFVQQPDITVPRPPNKPKDLAPDADAKAIAKHDADMKKYTDELAAKWTPEVQAQAKDAAAKLLAGQKEALEALSPANLEKEKIDGVIFANTTGDLPLPDKEGFIKWIEAGHAFIAMHSGSDTFHQFPAYAQMLGGEFKTHEFQVPADLIRADAAHPADAGLPATWNISQEEVYQFKNHDKDSVHVLWYLRHHPNHPDNGDTYAGVSWCKMAGKGRVFYTSLGHREDLWSDDPNLKDRKNSVEISKEYQKHILGGIEWALGLLPGDATPNPQQVK